MSAEEPELKASLSRVHCKVSEKDMADEKGLLMRDCASSSRGHKRDGLCIHQEETGEVL